MKFIKIFVDFGVKKISMGRYSNQVPGLALRQLEKPL
jgi:hypothetical protein